jgi:hypothetical protein
MAGSLCIKSYHAEKNSPIICFTAPKFVCLKIGYLIKKNYEKNE